MKKIIALLLLTVSLLTLASCTKLSADPMKLGKKLSEEYGDDAEIFIELSADTIEHYAEQFDISDDGVYAIMEIETSDDGIAYVIYCEKASQAKEVEEDCLDVVDEHDLDEDDYTVKRSGKVVFIGSEDILEEIQK